MSIAVFSLLLGLLGLDIITSITDAAASIMNVGPGLGPMIGPAGNFAGLPDAAQWILSFGMLMGRLELLTLLVLLSPYLWRR